MQVFQYKYVFLVMVVTKIFAKIILLLQHLNKLYPNMLNTDAVVTVVKLKKSYW